MDFLRLFVLVFFGSFAFGVIPGAWSPGVPPRSVSQSFLGLRDRRCVPLRISHVCPRTVLGFCVGSCPSSAFSSCWVRRLRSCTSSRSSLLLSCCVPFLCRQARVARRHARLGSSLKVQFLDKLFSPVVVLRQVPFVSGQCAALPVETL